MKTFEQCKQEIAEKYGFEYFEEIYCANLAGTLNEMSLDDYIDEAAELYASEVAKAQREACAENDKYITKDLDGLEYVLKSSILSTPLVTEKSKL